MESAGQLRMRKWKSIRLGIDGIHWLSTGSISFSHVDA